MALRLRASSTANALGVSRASKAHLSPSYSLSRCFSAALDGLKYATSHEWGNVEGSVATISITDHTQVDGDTRNDDGDDNSESDAPSDLLNRYS